MTRLAWCSRCDASHVSCAICHKSHLTCYDSPLESHLTCYHSPLTISALLARAREKGRPTLRSGRKSAPTVGTCCSTHVCHCYTHVCQPACPTCPTSPTSPRCPRCQYPTARCQDPTAHGNGDGLSLLSCYSTA